MSSLECLQMESGPVVKQQGGTLNVLSTFYLALSVGNKMLENEFAKRLFYSGMW